MSEIKSGIGRRTFIGGAVAGAAVTGFPHIAGAQAKVIKVGMPTILSGRVAILGTSSIPGVQVAFNAINAAGGIDGRKLELVTRDSKGRPDEAAKVTRDLINNDGCEIILDGEASSGSFAVHEVIRDLGVLCLHTNSESSTLTADPKQKVKTAFRCARQGIHDAVAGGSYAAKIAKEKGLKKWMTISPDYAYGRDNTAEFIQYAKVFEPSIEVVDQLWPKLFAPDYTESITKTMQVKPQAVYSALWGGDLVAFIEQSNLYRVFQNTAFFSGGLGDPPILTAIKNLPQGLNTAYRYNKKFPDNPGNEQFNDEYVKLVKHEPTNWGWQNFVAANFVIEALKRTAGKTDGAALASEVSGMQLKTPLGVGGTITMRDTDHTIINYPVAWGKTVSKAPWVVDYVDTEWSKILEIEQQWKKEKGWA
ncbi:ABC transporter substrate-binding protein [Enterovirga rhinocerotis]|uniref:Amino acid/amide ABC transporter substrate-binding protein (HAAT family) n=1 Tax=Enterovirga rhinocerotis TaxID=1339210 RepID=A0A4R7BS94_9HYPH|nr:ABC transporter substrate-binding protein [Enterovirga rhinocerotis]TDR88133.1 amino acid/amide ABC transporter substrate-binding protein (HAAT family) [Enterovirga rhinocerotis]